LDDREGCIVGLKIPDKESIEKQLLTNPEILKETLKNNPALIEYVFSDAEIQRKYIKINPKVEDDLKKISNETGIGEGVLLGLGIAFLLWIIFKDR